MRTALRWTTAVVLLVVLLCGGAGGGTASADEPALTVPAHLRPAVVPSPEPGIPAYVLVEARFSRVVTVGEGVWLEFRPLAGGDPADPRWHALWYRPCETNEVVAGFVESSLPVDEPVQIAVPVNPPETLRRQLTAKCQSGGYRTPAEVEGYAASLFATNLQTLRGEDAGVYLGGSLNSFVRLGRLRPDDQNRSSISADTSTTAATTIHSAGGAAGSASSSSNADSTSSASSSS